MMTRDALTRGRFVWVLNLRASDGGSIRRLKIAVVDRDVHLEDPSSAAIIRAPFDDVYPDKTAALTALLMASKTWLE